MLCQLLRQNGLQTPRNLQTCDVVPVRQSKERARRASRAVLYLNINTAASSAGVLWVREQETPQQETFELLEWPEVCKQVVAFTATTSAAEKLLSDYLPVGESQVCGSGSHHRKELTCRGSLGPLSTTSHKPCNQHIPVLFPAMGNLKHVLWRYA